MLFKNYETYPRSFLSFVVVFQNLSDGELGELINNKGGDETRIHLALNKLWGEGQISP
jgi:hypothetical protein